MRKTVDKVKNVPNLTNRIVIVKFKIKIYFSKNFVSLISMTKIVN